MSSEKNRIILLLNKSIKYKVKYKFYKIILINKIFLKNLLMFKNLNKYNIIINKKNKSIL